MKALDDIRPEVTEHDRRAYEVRKGMADEAREQYYAAMRALGPGYDAYGAWHLRDRMGLAPEQVFYCARKQGQRWLPDPPVRFEYERLPGRYFTKTDGTFIACGLRWEARLQVIHHNYSPQPPEKLAEARATRERKDILKKADDMPLFRETVIAGKFPFNKKPRKKR